MSAGARIFRSRELAELIRGIVGFRGQLQFRFEQARRHAAQTAGCIQAERAWLAVKINLREGIAATYQWFLSHQSDYRG